MIKADFQLLIWRSISSSGIGGELIGMATPRGNKHLHPNKECNVRTAQIYLTSWKEVFWSKYIGGFQYW